MAYPSFPADSYVPNHTEYADLWSQIKIQSEAPQIEGPLLPIEVNGGQCTIDRWSAQAFLAQYPDAPPQRLTVFTRRLIKSAVPVLTQCGGAFAWGTTLRARLTGYRQTADRQFATEIAALDRALAAPDALDPKSLRARRDELAHRRAGMDGLMDGLLWRAHRSGIPETEWTALVQTFESAAFRIPNPDGDTRSKQLHDLLALLVTRMTTEHLRQMDADLASGQLRTEGIALPALSPAHLSPALLTLSNRLATGQLKIIVIPSQDFTQQPANLQPALYDHARQLIAIRADFFANESQLSTLQWMLTHELGHAARALQPTRGLVVDIEAPEYDLQWRAPIADWGYSETRKYNDRMNQLATQFIRSSQSLLREPWTAYLREDEKAQLATLFEAQRVHAAAFAHAEAVMRTGSENHPALWERLRGALMAVDASALVVSSLRRLEIPYPRLIKQRQRDGRINNFDATLQVFNPDNLMSDTGFIEITPDTTIKLETPEAVQLFVNTNRPHYAQVIPRERINQPEEAILDLSQALLMRIALLRLEGGTANETEAKSLFTLWLGFIKKNAAATAITVRYE